MMEQREDRELQSSVSVISILAWSSPLTKIFHSVSLSLSLSPSLFESQNKPILKSSAKSSPLKKQYIVS